MYVGVTVYAMAKQSMNHKKKAVQNKLMCREKNGNICGKEKSEGVWTK